jgi:hypothetical protein
MVEYKIYKTARFHIPDGMYSIEEVEDLLVWMKKTKQRNDEYLKSSMRPSEERIDGQR